MFKYIKKLIIPSFFLTLLVSTSFAGLLRVSFINVGQGDAIFLEFPSGNNMLIDSGKPAMGTVVANFIKKRNINTINHLVMTHPHSDHIGGMGAIFRNFDIENVYDSGRDYKTDLYYNTLDMIEEYEDIEYHILLTYPMC